MKFERKKLLRRALALVLAVTMCFSMLQIGAAAKTTVDTWACGQSQHTHTDACYATEQKLICALPEVEGHVHTDDKCYVVNRIEVFNCGLEKGECGKVENPSHIHEDSCYDTVQVLSCGQEAVPGHAHVTECYDVDGNVICGQEVSEGHTHTDACYTIEKTSTTHCGLDDKVNLPAEEVHTHGPDCNPSYIVDKQLVCEIEEVPAHKHGSECYTDVTVLNCTQTEHVHDPKTCKRKENEQVLTDLNTALGNSTGKKEPTSDDLEPDDDDTVTLILDGFELKLYAHNSEKLDGLSEDEKKYYYSIRVENGASLIILDGIIAITEAATEAGTEGSKIIGNGQDRVITVKDGGHLELNGDTTITGGSTGATGGGIVVLNGSTAVMNGGKVEGNNAASGGGVAVENNSTFTMNGGEIFDNTTKGNGGGVSVDNSTFVMNGGTISSNDATKGGGVGVNNGKFTMNSGTIDGNHAVYEDSSAAPKWHADGQGGGVYVIGDKGVFELNNGKISNNTAYEGGGIFIASKNDTEQKGKLIMKNGLIDGNTAEVGEGGGIYIRGEATISAGQISNNQTYSTSDLGGGGIYIEHNGSLKLTDTLIKENAAAGLGAGIAACVNGKTYVYAEHGAAIYDNKAKVDENGNVMNEAGYINKETGGNGSYIDGSSTWLENANFQNGTTDENGKTTGSSKDVLIASANKKENVTGGNPGTVFSNEMLGGGLANWSGTSYETTTPKTEDGKEWQHSDPQTIDGSNNRVIVAGGLLGLQSDPLETAKKAAEALAKVLIFGNKSYYTHGGGIANNGTLTIGTNPGDDTIKGIDSNMVPTIDLEKTLTGRPLKDGEFNFELYDADGNTIEGYTVTNDANGKAQIRLPEQYFTAKNADGNYYDGDYVFYFRETPGNDNTVDYDKSNYRVVISVKTETDDKNIQIGEVGNGGAVKYTITKRKISYEPIKEKELITDIGRVWSFVNDIHFVNHAHPTTEPPRETPSPTPTTPPTPTPTPSEQPTPTPSEEPTPAPSEEPTPAPTDEPIEDDPVPLGTPTPAPSDEPIEDDPVPLGTPTPEPNVPEEVPTPTPIPQEPDEELPDPDVPLADVPKTGDEDAIWYMLTFVCASGLAVLMLTDRRKKTVK